MSKRLVIIEEDRLLEIFVEALKIATGGNLKDVPYVSHADKKDKYLTREEAAKKCQ